jgi:hypothetical protein
MFNEHIHGPFDRIECNVGYPSRYSCSPSASLGSHYNFEGGIGFLKTHDTNWHRLMRNMRHKQWQVPHIHLYISKSFWDLVHWRKGAEEVLAQRSLRNSPNPHSEDCPTPYCVDPDCPICPNFLTKVAKFAAPAPRWMNHSRRDEVNYDPEKDWYYCTRGTTLRITIEDTDSEERQAFVQKLERTIRKMRRARSLYSWNKLCVGVVTYTRDSRE